MANPSRQSRDEVVRLIGYADWDRFKAEYPHDCETSDLADAFAAKVDERHPERVIDPKEERAREIWDAHMRVTYLPWEHLNAADKMAVLNLIDAIQMEVADGLR